MQEFIKLIEKLDTTTATNEKTAAIASYFSRVPAADAVWALFFLSGNRFKRFVSGQKLRQWCEEVSQIPDWLFLECYARVGDTAELIALMIQTEKQNVEMRSLNSWMEEFIIPLKNLPEENQRQLIVESWKRQSQFERFVMNKILTGAFRIGISSLLTIRGLSQAFSIPTSTLSLKLSGDWEPSETFFRSLTSETAASEEKSLNPYPFFLASPLEENLESLGDPSEWFAEWKWDGIRAQLIYQKGEKALWSRGNELITGTFPEIIEPEINFSMALDGEILVYENDKPKPFADLQKRLGRKRITSATLKQFPAIFMIYDVLEWEGEDIRQLPLIERHEKIQDQSFLLSSAVWKLSPLLAFTSWDEVKNLREEAKRNGTEGLVLKRKNSPYGIGRRRGSWWKYKVDNMSVDAVLLYAQPGSGQRSGLYTDYTFAVWDKNELVPIAKAYSGLTQEEIKEVDKWIRRETVEKFGPVRRVKPELVFEIAFENILLSNRHKAGLAVRFPRIKAWRKDKSAAEADTLDSLRQLHKERSHGS